jgi:hypothetical protein
VEMLDYTKTIGTGTLNGKNGSMTARGMWSLTPGD